jgi:hypothetical protein
MKKSPAPHPWVPVLPKLVKIPVLVKLPVSGTHTNIGFDRLLVLLLFTITSNVIFVVFLMQISKSRWGSALQNGNTLPQLDSGYSRVGVDNMQG